MTKSTCNLALMLVASLVSSITFSGDLSKLCSFNNCSAGDVVVTYNQPGSPAVRCPTKELSRYANFVVTSRAMGITEANAAKTTPASNFAASFAQLRSNSGAQSFKAAMQKCTGLEDYKLVTILEYGENGAVKVSPGTGKSPYWTQSNHLEHP